MEVQCASAPNEQASPGAPPDTGVGIGDLLAIGFGTTVAMWAVGYVGWMPLCQIRPPVFVTGMLVCLVAGGWIAGRYTRRGVGGGVWIGLISATLNLLILGSLLQHPPEGQSPPPAWLWLPGVLLASSILGGLGALAGKSIARRPSDTEPNWIAGFGWVISAAALLLIAVGGLVTGFRAGMAVPNWPGSFEYNMFLFPLASMTGGVFYEHAHRLLGTLLGLSTLVMAVYLSATARPRRGLMALAWLAGTGVAIQGILGGFRVTEDNYVLAVVHGAFAHAVLGGVVLMEVILSRGWRTDTEGEEGHSSGADRLLSLVLVGLVFGQTLLGVLRRQLGVMLVTHASLAAIVALAALGTGMRAWGLNPHLAVFRRAGVALMLVVLLQILLGITVVAFPTPTIDRSPDAAMLDAQGGELPVAPAPALITTAHQLNAAVMFALSVYLAGWTWRLQAFPGHGSLRGKSAPADRPASCPGFRAF
jgi:heme A synthase